jgi:hypothetical protein
MILLLITKNFVFSTRAILFWLTPPLLTAEPLMPPPITDLMMSSPALIAYRNKLFRFLVLIALVVWPTSSAEYFKRF